MTNFSPRKLRPAELLRLINSTPLGAVLTERQFRAQRDAAGLRITSQGDPKSIDLLRYAGWLHALRHAPPTPTAGAQNPTPAAGNPGQSRTASGGVGGYEAHKERARDRQAEQSKSGRDIAPIPPVKDPARRAACERDLRRYAETYFPGRFPLAWSQDHITFWRDLQHTVEHGGQLARAMPRGSGKTTMIEVAAIFAVSYGHRRYVVTLGPTRPDALKMLRAIKVELESNDLLLEDFPEICYPIRRLDGIAQRSKGQHIDGARTKLEWGKECVVLPTVAGSRGSGAILEVRSITGAIRGMKHSREDGTISRPDLLLVDDMQTKKSAKSVTQCQEREEILHGDVLGCAGPGVKIACLLTCTVIRKGDVADRVLDRSIRPQWQGVRVPMVRRFPTAERLWDQYADARREGLTNGDHGALATAFYRANREAMDKGAEVYWPARHDPDELSAVQHAMNRRIDDEESFWAECQNDPREDQAESLRLQAREIEAKIAGVDRGVVPLACHTVTAFIDVQHKLLWYAVAAFSSGFSGALIEYGAFPDQGVSYFSKRDAKRTLARAFPGAGVEGRTLAGLHALVGDLLGRQWKNEAGTPLPVSRLLIDAGDQTDTVYQFARETSHRAIVLPSHGKGISGAQMPMIDWPKKPGDKVGQHWRIALSAKRASPYVLIDTNWWKSFLAARLRLAPGDRGSLSIFKASVARHQMLIDHLTAETPHPDTGRGHDVDVWKQTPNRDNDLLDCFVGCCVAASIAGVTADGHTAHVKRPRIKLSELQARKR